MKPGGFRNHFIIIQILQYVSFTRYIHASFIKALQADVHENTIMAEYHLNICKVSSKRDMKYFSIDKIQIYQSIYLDKQCINGKQRVECEIIYRIIISEFSNKVRRQYSYFLFVLVLFLTTFNSCHMIDCSVKGNA